jgi:hypothetical protein
MEASTEAWSKAVGQMASHGQAPMSPPDPTVFWRQFTDPGSATWASFQTAGPVDPDVLKQWRRFLDDWIAAWTKALEQAMGTDAFGEALGKTLDQFLTLQDKTQEAVQGSSKATLDALGLPSKDQIIGLSRQLMDLEDRLESLEDQIGALGGPEAAAPAKKKAPRKRSKSSGVGRKKAKKRGTKRS